MKVKDNSKHRLARGAAIYLALLIASVKTGYADPNEGAPNIGDLFNQFKQIQQQIDGNASAQASRPITPDVSAASPSIPTDVSAASAEYIFDVPVNRDLIDGLHQEYGFHNKETDISLEWFSNGERLTVALLWNCRDSVYSGIETVTSKPGFYPKRFSASTYDNDIQSSNASDCRKAPLTTTYWEKCT